MGGGDGEKRGRSWAELDSNQRRREPADLQSAPFGHFGIRPCTGKTRKKEGCGQKRSQEKTWSLRGFAPFWDGMRFILGILVVGLALLGGRVSGQEAKLDRAKALAELKEIEAKNEK